MMKLTLSCVVFVAVLFLHAQHASADSHIRPDDAVDWKSGDSVEDDDASINDDDSKESGEFYHITTVLESALASANIGYRPAHTKV